MPPCRYSPVRRECTERHGHRPKPQRNDGRRALVALAAALLLATMVYGERWVLDEPATACVECAVAVSVARALDGESAER